MQQNISYNVTLLRCLDVSPMLSADKIKDKVLGEVWKTCCDLVSGVAPQGTRPPMCRAGLRFLRMGCCLWLEDFPARLPQRKP